MPDSQGRYTLSDMRDRVRRLMNLKQQTIDPTTGAETGSTIVGQDVSNTDINNQLNMSYQNIALEIMENREEQFTTTAYISTKAGVFRYSFPFNMIQWRSLRWKNPGLTQWTDSDYHAMVVYDEADRRTWTGTLNRPTWRPEGDTFVLSWDNDAFNTIDNPQGIQIRGVFLPNELSKDTDVIQFTIARILQQYIIYDAAVELLWSKKKQVTQEVQQGRDRWYSTVIKTIDNRFHPSAIQFVSERLVKHSYSGR